jgi:multimeric flavodoxin WrbA
VACGACRKNNTRCAFSDALYDQLHAILEAGIDGVVVGSPVYYAGPNGSLCALLDRLFYSCSALMAYKPAAAVAVCRRGGASATFDRLNKYFTINNMPVVPSQYWNSVHGAAAGEALEDLEGLQTMRTLGKNMVWMLRDLQTEHIPASEEKKIKTSFVR